MAKFALKKQEPTESEVLNVIGEYLSLRKHFFFRVNNAPTFQPDANGGHFRRQSKWSLNGVPDLILIDSAGMFVGLEIKRPSGRQSPEQCVFEQRCKQKGAKYYVVRNVDDVVQLGL